MRGLLAAIPILAAMAALSCAQQARAAEIGGQADYACAKQAVRLTIRKQGDGEWLLRLNQDQLRSYILGFTGAMLASSVVGVSEACLDKMWVCIDGKSSQQLAAVVRKEVDGNPKSWDSPGNVLVFNAIFAECMKN
jgi:hypothetical protein